MAGKRALRASLKVMLWRALPPSAVVTWLSTGKLAGQRPLQAALVAVVGGVPVLAVGAPVVDGGVDTPTEESPKVLAASGGDGSVLPTHGGGVAASPAGWWGGRGEGEGGARTRGPRRRRGRLGGRGRNRGAGRGGGPPSGWGGRGGRRRRAGRACRRSAWDSTYACGGRHTSGGTSTGVRGAGVSGGGTLDVAYRIALRSLRMAPASCVDC